MNLRQDPPADGPANMAADSELLEAAESGKPSARIYSWDGPWVTLGRFQDPAKAIVPGFSRWTIRPTGGRAVLHGHDVTVGLAVPHAGTGSSRKVKDVYRALVGPLARALASCGLGAELAEATRYAGQGSGSADCFAFSSPNDVVDPWSGRKACGCALRITDRAALLQASIPSSAPLILPSSAIVGAKEVEIVAWDVEAFPDAFARELAALDAVR